MTTLTTHHLASSAPVAGVTRFERTLLRAASALDAFVLTRLAHRSGPERRHALAVQTATTRARGEAQARAAVGILPR